MHKRFGLYIIAILSLTACVSDEYNSGIITQGDGAISFSNAVNPFTRAAKTGKEAADLLGSNFYVYGIKNESTTTGDVTSENLVFPNYKVSFTDGSASTSNTAGWEYVGKSLSSQEVNHLTANNGTDAQLIKYWDNNATDYTFYAIAVAGNDLAEGKITIQKVTNSEDSPYTKGYNLTVAADATPANIYVADRKYLTKNGSSYGSPVTFTFRNAMAKVRVAMYETIPGYSLTIDAFRVATDDGAPTFAQMTTEETTRFAANLQNAQTGKAETLTVSYHDDTNTTTQNTPAVKIDSKDNVLTLGDNIKANTQLGTDAASAVYDRSDKTYTPVYPMEENANNLKLKVDFTLTAKTGETIKVKNATAEVPAAYLQWKPGYAYTYIFKISDQTNATIGSLTGLYPITFDALNVVDGIGQEEVISTISGTMANIVTMGYDASTKRTTVNADDYQEGNTVFASTIYDKNLVAPTSQNTQLYIATTTDADNYPITEANVKTYLAEYEANTQLVDQPVTVYAQTLSDDNYVSQVPMGDGTDDVRTLSAMKWTAGKHVYAVEFTQSDTKYYKIVKIDNYNGLTTGTLSLTPAVIENSGGTMTPSLTVDGTTPSNAEVTYALGTGVPAGITIQNNGTAKVSITVPRQTTAGTYTLIATYQRRTYRTTFTVNQ